VPDHATLEPEQVRRILALRDLTDPTLGHHAIQELVDRIARAVAQRWPTTLRRRHANPIVTVTDNYDRLGFSPDAVARDARYSRYLTDELMLRTHTSAMLPLALEELAARGQTDVTLLCPGMVYRRDAIDRHHVGEPHQLDLWRVIHGDGPPMSEEDLDALVALVLDAALPGRAWRATPSPHPYTVAGRQVDVRDDGTWVEVGECGLARPGVLRDAGLPASASGLASGWGLDRLLMLAKGIDDVRLLRSDDPRIAGQMHDLAPYRPVSSMPPASRDLSLAMSGPPDVELLGDRLRAALGDEAHDVEAVEILDVTPGDELPDAARARLGMRPGQHNVVVRVVLRALGRTLTSSEANRLRDRIYALLHEGSVHHWAGGGPPT
jgi:phenylalanyl-tRNA synthetase alpha chain